MAKARGKRKAKEVHRKELSMKYKLRDYQKDMIAKAVAALTSDNPKPSILVGSTGMGKSLVVAGVCYALSQLDPEAGVLVLQPSREILEQNFEKIKSYGIDDIKVYSASANSKEVGRYTMATIGSIYKKPELFKHVRYCLVDECQDCAIDSNGMYMKFFDEINLHRIVGLTATPFKQRTKVFRRKGWLEQTASVCMLNRFPPMKSTKTGKNRFAWGKILYKIEMSDLQERGYLVPIKYFVELPKAELRLNKSKSNYTDDSMEEFASRTLQRIYDVTRAVVERGNPKRVLVFAPSVKSAYRLSEALCRANIKADAVDGKTPKKERAERIEKFKTGETQVIVNCMCLSVGFDLPALDTIVFAKPTMSPAVFMQAIGRGVRVDPENPDKVLKVYDLTGCTKTISRVENIHIKKEDGFRDMLVGDNGRIDNVELYRFKIPKSH